MIININTNWKNIIEDFDKNQKKRFEEFIKEEREKYKNNLEIYPPDNKIFRCFSYFNIENTKVVLIGQDPYHGKNQATGLCFDIDIKSNCKYPPSLLNIEKLLSKKPNFEDWAQQGILLLNSSLSVLKGKPRSHLKYWLPFTKFIINKINDKCNNIIFIIWGAFALSLCELIDVNKHTIYISSHPSPLSCYKKLKNYPSFNESDIFNKITNINW